jgi:nanoRNase/pAp phosphatase (c-di-AMP/oligoRNAs hydrolase)
MPSNTNPTLNGKYRLLTRSDMDGLICAVLLKDMGILGDIKFVHPKDVQDGKIEVNDRDILTNLPYVPGCALCFDHHSSEETRNSSRSETPGYVLESGAKSAARVVYNYFGGKQRFPTIGDDMMEAVDKADSAGFNADEVLNPTGWDLMSFIMDARTGLGRFRNFRVSNYQLMMALIDCCKDLTIEQILQLPDVQERVELFFAQHEKFREQLLRVGRVHDNLIVLDLRDEEVIFAGNRFVVYALFPQCNISMHVLWGVEKRNTVYTVGKSIFNRTCPLDVGDLMLQYGGGGHHAAGTCQLANENSESGKLELIERILAGSRQEELVAV